MKFYQQPRRRFAGTRIEHLTFFLEDPSQNLLEFKHYLYESAIFGELVFHVSRGCGVSAVAWIGSSQQALFSAHRETLPCPIGWRARESETGFRPPPRSNHRMMWCCRRFSRRCGGWIISAWGWEIAARRAASSSVNSFAVCQSGDAQPLPLRTPLGPIRRRSDTTPESVP